MIQHHPKIVTNGLILHLDAANKKSYSGTGSAWQDLSSVKNTATLNGSPQFNPLYGGYFTFNGTASQYAQVVNAAPYNFTTDLFTLECWAAATSNAGYGRFFDHAYATGYAFMVDIEANGGRIVFEVNGNSPTRTIYDKGSTFKDGIWRQYVAVRTGSTTASLYVNGINVVNGNIVGGTLTSTNALQINSSSYPLGCNIAISRVYNRALTASEILKNYNATKGRFGL